MLAQVVKALPPDIHELARINIWDLREASGRQRAKELGVKSVPALYLNQAQVFTDQIPGPDELARHIRVLAGEP